MWLNKLGHKKVNKDENKKINDYLTLLRIALML